jgi:hypothetical protein
MKVPLLVGFLVVSGLVCAQGIMPFVTNSYVRSPQRSSKMRNFLRQFSNYFHRLSSDGRISYHIISHDRSVVSAQQTPFIIPLPLALPRHVKRRIKSKQSSTHEQFVPLSVSTCLLFRNFYRSLKSVRRSEQAISLHSQHGQIKLQALSMQPPPDCLVQLHLHLQLGLLLSREKRVRLRDRRWELSWHVFSPLELDLEYFSRRIE